MAAYTAQRCIGLHGASRHTQPRLVRVGCSSRRPAMVVRAVLDKANQGTTTTAGSRVTVLSLMSSCVSIDAAVTRFEVLAGRSAMIGFLVAVGAELITERPALSLSVDQGLAFGAAALAAVTLAGVAATVRGSAGEIGDVLQEAVISSLTAVQRSAASVTQRQVDKAVDYLLESAFGSSVLGAMVDGDSEFI